MMRAQYIRFREAIMTPGRAGNTIRKALLRPKPPKRGDKPAPTPTVPADELMDDILVGETWVVLKARRRFGGTEPVMCVRLTHVSNVADVEPAEDQPDEDEPTPKKGTNQ